jgi:hypothetical protein
MAAFPEEVGDRTKIKESQIMTLDLSCSTEEKINGSSSVLS